MSVPANRVLLSLASVLIASCDTGEGDQEIARQPTPGFVADGEVAVHEELLRALFDLNCRGRETQPCDDYDAYEWRVSLSEREVDVYFFHKDLERLGYDSTVDMGFFCYRIENREWECLSEHR